MERRTFLATTTTVAAASVAGCFGYTVQSTDDVEGRKDTIETLEANLEENTSALSKTRSQLNTTNKELKQTKVELEEAKETVSDQDTTISDLRSEKSRLQSDVNELEAEVQSVEAATTEMQAKTVLTTYSYAIALANDGHNLYRSGTNNADAADYLPASYDFYEAEAYYNSAANIYDLTVDRANEFNFGTVSGWADESRDKIKSYKEAAADFGLAYLNYAVDSNSTGNEYIESGNAHLENAQEYQSRSLTVLETELGYEINLDETSDDSNVVRAGRGG